MIAELISVGTEILLGNIVNTNAQYLSKKLASLGIDVHYQTVVGDNSDRIKNTLDVAFSRGDTVILTGGLGPTKDDMTKEMLISYFHKKPVLDKSALAALEARLKMLNVEMTEHHKKQAIVPDDSIVLINHNGTAPGVIMEDAGKTAILLPGPPKEMKPMFEEYVVDYLAKRSGKVFVSVNIKMLDFDHAPVRIVGEAPCASQAGHRPGKPDRRHLCEGRRMPDPHHCFRPVERRSTGAFETDRRKMPPASGRNVYQLHQRRRGMSQHTRPFRRIL